MPIAMLLPPYRTDIPESISRTILTNLTSLVKLFGGLLAVSVRLHHRHREKNHVALLDATWAVRLMKKMLVLLEAMMTRHRTT